MSSQIVNQPNMAGYNAALLANLGIAPQPPVPAITEVAYIPPPESAQKELSFQQMLMEAYSKTGKFADWNERVNRSFGAFVGQLAQFIDGNPQMKEAKQREFLQTTTGQQYANEQENNLELFRRQVMKFYLENHKEEAPDAEQAAGQ